MNSPNRLEEKIINLSTKYIYNEAINSFLLLIMDCAENEKSGKDFLYYPIHSDIKDIQNKINKYVLNLEAIIDGSHEIKSSSLEDCLDIKKDIVSIYKVIDGYTSSLSIYAEAVNYEISLRKTRENDLQLQTIDFNMILADCKDFLNSAENEESQCNYISQILNCSPLKMTRDKYYDCLQKCISNSLINVSEDAINESINIFKRKISPEKSQNHGKYFTDIAELLGEKYNIKPSMLTDEELNEEFTDINSVFATLEKIENYFNTIFNDINYLIIIFYLDFTFEDITGPEFAYSDSYYSVCEILNNKNEDEKIIMIDSVCDVIEANIEYIIDTIAEISNREVSLLDKINQFSDLSEYTTKTLLTEHFIKTTYFEYLDDFINAIEEYKNPTIASEIYREKKINELIDYAKEYFMSMPVQYRKTAMSSLLFSIPYAISVDETYNYIKMCIETASKLEHKTLIAYNICNVLLDYGFGNNDLIDENDLDDDFDDCGHEHHDGCDCEHDHH